ncbi:MAG: DUF4255 domain-containing protein [Oscillospiraceae bacterium]|jgi:hypothetical protein|nr:DUF4255 domain-containing protein [Oscillospiraceae bacterium]
MADYTAIVEAGESLVALLRDALTPEPISNGEHISLCSPHESEDNQLTVHLFHVEEEAQNSVEPYYQQSRDVLRAQPSNFQLSFLLTAHSKAPAQMREADRHRIIGAALRQIKDSPALARSYLKGSLADSGADLRLSVERQNFEQMSKIWNNSASPYKLSIVCKVSGVSIDSKRERSVKRVSEIEISVEEARRQ